MALLIFVCLSDPWSHYYIRVRVNILKFSSIFDSQIRIHERMAGRVYKKKKMNWLDLCSMQLHTGKASWQNLHLIGLFSVGHTSESTLIFNPH